MEHFSPHSSEGKHLWTARDQIGKQALELMHYLQQMREGATDAAGE
jgi:hypothetical protein